MYNSQNIIKKYIFSALLVLTLSFMSSAVFAQSSLVQVETKGSVSQTVSHLKKMVSQNGMMVMGSLNQGKVLSMTGIHVQSETVFVGNPHVGKQLFSADHGVGVAVPVRVNIYANKQGNTVVSYIPPSQVLGHFNNPKIQKIAKMLDNKLNKMVHMLAK
ncbi:MAG TPA: DUF302 domain-containing protein [Balneolales bacterium]|nr:DUF302 domain-containing protein [Balneolales bacterium]